MSSTKLRTTATAVILAVAFLLLAFLSPAAAVPSDWWRFHGNTASTGYSADAGTLYKALNWKFDTGAPVGSSAAVVDSMVYVANNDGVLWCLDAFEGKEIWNATLCPSRGVDASPAVYNGVVYIGDNEGVMHALNAWTGEEIWNYTTGGPIMASPNILESAAADWSRLYFSSYESKVFCLDLNGKHIWNYTAGYWVHTSVTYYDSKVFAGTCDGNLYALDSETGSVVWNFSAAYFPSTPAVRDGLLFAGCNDNELYCLNQSTGALVWNYTTDSGIFSSPAVDDDNVFVGSDKYMHSVDIATGKKNWEFKTGATVDSSPLVTPASVVFGSADKYIYCIDKTTGREDWRFGTDGDITASPAVYAGNIYIGSMDGSVYCLGLTKDINPPNATLVEPLDDVVIGEKYILRGTASDDKFLYNVWVSYDKLVWEEVEEYDDFKNWTFSLNTSQFEPGEQELFIRVSDGHYNVTDNYTFRAVEPEDDQLFDPMIMYMIFGAIILAIIVMALVYTQKKDKKK